MPAHLEWTAALAEGTRSFAAALVARGLIGSTEVQALAEAALQDGAFAAAAGDIERCDVVDESTDVPLLPVADGIAADSLLSETARRLDSVASLPFPVSPYRDRVVPAGGTEPAGLTAGREQTVAHANGRRSARDIAFAVGRSLHPVTVEVSRMLGEGLLEIAPPATSFSFSHWGAAPLRARADAGRTAGHGVVQDGSLPARRRPAPRREEVQWTTTPWSPSCGSSGRTSPE